MKIIQSGSWSSTRAIKFLMAAALLVTAVESQASLGSTRAAGLSVHAAVKLTSGAPSPAGYTESQSTLESGTVVREYADSTGIVFAVSWVGPYLPNLKELLGTHFDTMVAQASADARRARSPVRVNSSEVVVLSGGHMGAFEGRAWLPAKLPAGFTFNGEK